MDNGRGNDTANITNRNKSKITLDAVIERLQAEIAGFAELAALDVPLYVALQRYSTLSSYLHHFITRKEDDKEEKRSNGAVSEQQLNKLIVVIDSSLAAIDDYEQKNRAQSKDHNKGAGEQETTVVQYKNATSFLLTEFSRLQLYAAKRANEMETKIVFSRKAYQTRERIIHLTQLTGNTLLEIISRSIAGEIADFVAKNVTDAAERIRYGERCHQQKNDAVLVRQRILAQGNFIAYDSVDEHLQHLARDHSDAGNAARKLLQMKEAAITTDESILLCEQWYQHKNSAAELQEQLGNLLEAKLQFIHAFEALSVMNNFIITDSERKIEREKNIYSLAMKIAQLSVDINDFPTCLTNLEHAITATQRIMNHASNITEQREYGKLAYQLCMEKAAMLELLVTTYQEDRQHAVFALFKEADIEWLLSQRIFLKYEEAADIAEILARHTADTAETIEYLEASHRARYLCARNGLRNNRLLPALYGALDAIKLNYFLGVLKGDEAYIERAVRSIPTVRKGADYFLNSHKAKINYHLLEAEIVGAILQERYDDAVQGARKICERSNKKDYKPIFYDCITEVLASGRLEMAKGMVEAYTDTLSGQSSINHMYKPMLLFHFSNLVKNNI